jgi:uncharacterized protein YbbC (DUF1343 family)
VEFRPASANFSGKTIEGVHLAVTDRDAFSSSRLGLELARALETLYPRKVAMESTRYLIGSSAVMRALAAGKDAGSVADAGIQQFGDLRRKYLLYH